MTAARLDGITRLDADAFRDSVGDLAELLLDGVAGGASLGFLGPLDAPAAAQWWSGQAAAALSEKKRMPPL